MCKIIGSDFSQNIEDSSSSSVGIVGKLEAKPETYPQYPHWKFANELKIK
jgi:hypothetical protein